MGYKLGSWNKFKKEDLTWDACVGGEKGLSRMMRGGFPGGAVVENLPANAGDTGSSPGLGRSHILRSN